MFEPTKSNMGTVKQFSPEWWAGDKNVTMAWCHKFCDGINPPVRHDPDIYGTVGIVLFHQPDGKIVPVGITAQQDNSFVFQYHPDYLANPSLPAIASTLPKQNERFEAKGKLLNFFDNLLSEGWLGREQAIALESNPERVDNDNEFLSDRYKRLMMFGRDTPGAISVIYVKIDPELVQKKHQEIVAGALNSRSSISGQQSKLLAIEGNDGRFTPTNHLELSTHIAKLPSEKLPALREYEYMSIVATTALLPHDDCVEAQLRKLHLRNESPRDVLAIKRFDRTPEGGKIHFEEINQILDKPSTERCEGDYYDIAKVINEKVGHEGVKKFYARLLSQFLLNNTDNHMKNFALFHDNGEWKMTPSYDLAPSGMYRYEEINKNRHESGGIGGDGTKAREQELVLGIKGLQVEK